MFCFVIGFNVVVNCKYKKAKFKFVRNCITMQNVVFELNVRELQIPKIP